MVVMLFDDEGVPPIVRYPAPAIASRPIPVLVFAEFMLDPFVLRRIPNVEHRRRGARRESNLPSSRLKRLFPPLGRRLNWAASGALERSLRCILGYLSRRGSFRFVLLPAGPVRFARKESSVLVKIGQPGNRLRESRRF